MSKVRIRDTAAELAIRRILHRKGLRYRVNLQFPDLGRARPDIAFTRVKLAVFVDGCFWHRCPEHATYPTSNSEWWLAKLEKNVARDRAIDQLMSEGGWTVMRIWEHEDPLAAANDIEAHLRALNLDQPSRSTSV